MDTVPANPDLPPIPADDFNDIGTAGSKFGDWNRVNADICLEDGQLAIDYNRAYYGCVNTVDKLVGRLIEAVDDSDEEWFVVITSDHGFHLLDKQLMTKFTLWPQATQVPLLLYGN